MKSERVGDSDDKRSRSAARVCGNSGLGVD